MSGLGIAARVALGLVFVASAIFKLTDTNWMVSAANLGVPSWLARLVPWWELLLGALLIPSLLTPFAAIAAGWTLIGFSVLIATELRAGRRPTCACFGARSTKPISAMTLVRNGGLIVLAGVAAVLS
jgi:uncharacterized membrane protein YphA (DoxX/SURF4 family)